MKALPVIVGFGGINPAGRASFHHAYRRMVIDALGEADQRRTYASLGGLMGLADPDDPATRDHIDRHTLVRRIELWDPDAVPVHCSTRLAPRDGEPPLHFELNERQVPDDIPAHWTVEPAGARTVRVTVRGELAAMLPHTQVSRVSSAGQLPKGFDPGELYPSRSHPRGLQMTVYGASDALRSSGIDIADLKNAVRPDEIAVYSGSAMGQLDNDGYGGLFQNPLLGRRPTSKNVALGLNEMPGDFINAYVLGSVGGAAGIIGACATFLYNVRHGIEDIMAGRKRIVIAGNSEAPVVPDVIEGYRMMGALAEDDKLKELDGSSTVDHRRACRPFSTNAGFTVAESAIFAVIMDDRLALELGARVLGSVGGVFVNADGYKKSIPGPGIGNYLSVGKAMGLARAILGDEGLRRGTHVQAHGTGTPQNRVTESHILNEMAKLHGIERWPVAAIKSYVGHSMAPAGGDQLAAVLGTWEHGLLPGITTIDHIADDVHDSNLHLPFDHLELDPADMRAAFINSKGFGGNNATGLFLASSLTEQMLTQRHGTDAMLAYRRRNEAVAAAADDYDQRADSGEIPPIYRFGEGVLEGDDLDIGLDEITVPGFTQTVRTRFEHPWSDMV